MPEVLSPDPLRRRAEVILRRVHGGAQFRDGQYEAIHALVKARSRLLLVQKTGWGKSAVYFVAAKLLREGGAGPTLIISPLLSLMRNQVQMAVRGGVEALVIHSDNEPDWPTIEARLRTNFCDILMISPERLANDRFRRTTLPSIPLGIGLLVVDEAHCISDWGHDFRPDYRRVVEIVRRLPRSIPILATTATANNRVVEDVVAQLGPNVDILRGSLARPTLRLQTIRLADQSERLAWLAKYLNTLPGSGIIYCLTIADCERIAGWLRHKGVMAEAYHAGLANEVRITRENQLLKNQIKVLVSTVALGMGFDKPDLGFVIHYQRPGSVVSYYQQIGRAGRASQDAYAILLNGQEDDEIQNYFIQSAFPTDSEMREVVRIVEEAGPVGANAIQQQVNLSKGRIDRCLKLLFIDGVVARDGRGRYFRTPNPWMPDDDHARRVTGVRYRELERMKAFVASKTCLMEFIARELDDPTATPCGRCAVCQHMPLVPTEVDAATVLEAVAFFKGDARLIEPRKQLPSNVFPELNTRIPQQYANLVGVALCVYGDAGWGRAVRTCKYRDGEFSEDLVDAMIVLLSSHLRSHQAPRWVTAIPSLRHPTLVPNFARQLADRLQLPFRSALTKAVDVPEQKTMQNSAQQAYNAASAFAVAPDQILDGAVLLIDDIMDSGWTLTVCGILLRDAGSGPVIPATLACMPGASGGT